MSGARVEARGWGWRHAGRRRWAVSGLDLEIEPGERILLLGASGAGKSTLLRGLAGVLGDAEDGEGAGVLTVDGRDPAAARGRAGLVLQDPDSQVVLARVGDDVAFGCENLGVGRDEIWRRVDAALDAVGLRVPREHPTTALSGGQKQRLALAGALAMSPGLLLLDEPTANLDPVGAVQVRDAVTDAAARTGATLVVVEHRVALWADHVDRVVVIDAAGGVLASGSPNTVFADHAETLTAAGVWVPGVRPVVTVRARTDPAPALLTAAALSVGRRDFGERTPRVAASGIDLTLRRGRTLAITGPNGAGKSTLAMTLAGLREPVAGTVVADPVLRGGARAEPHRWRSRELLTRIGMVFQEPEHQLLTGRVRDELAVGPRALGLGEADIAARVDPLLDRLRLGHLAEANPFTLSGGEKRRLTVAAAIVTEPAVLLLDEPTYGQDARTWRELADLIDGLRAAGTAIGMVSHDPELVGLLADEVAEVGA
ncbi:ABC transporter ATP-binding protein [Microbacterium sp. GXF7504]